MKILAENKSGNRKKRRNSKFIILWGAVWVGIHCMFPVASAQTLAQLWERVVTSEPAVLSALAQVRILEEREKQAKAVFYPQINLTANTTYNHRGYQTMGTNPAFTDDRYNSNGAQLTVTQSLWKQANLIAAQQSSYAVKQAKFQMLSVQQEVMAKLVSAWAEWLYAGAALQTAQLSVVAAQQQMGVFERGLSLGVYAISQREEAKLKWMQAVAESHVAQSELYARHSALEALVGGAVVLDIQQVGFAMRKAPFGEIPNLSELLTVLETDNPMVRAAHQAVLAAREEVSKQQAAHGASLDFVATAARTAQPTAGITPGQPGYKNRTDSYALQLNWPLYGGGAQSAKVREVLAMLSKAEHELDSAQRLAISQVKQAWAQLRSTIAKIDAAQQGVIAAQAQARVAENGVRLGTKTLLDVMQTKQQIDIAKRDGLRIYYDNIIQMSKLLVATGSLEESSLIDIQSRLEKPVYFETVPILENEP